MSMWSLAAAAVLAGAAVGVPQQAQQNDKAMPAPTVDVQSEQRVSVDFTHASVSDVLAWLSKNGVSFVAADPDLPKDVTIDLSVKDRPMDEVLDAVASALNGHWDRQGGMLVFRKGEGWGVHGFGLPNRKVFVSPPNMKSFKNFDGDGSTFFMPDIPDLKALKDLPQLKDLPDLKDLPKIDMKDMPNFYIRADPAARAEVEKEMQQAMREAQKAMSERGDAMKADQKAMNEARIEMEKARKEHPEAFQGRVFVVPSGKDFDYNWTPGDMGKNWKVVTPEMWKARSGDLKKFMNSLSEEQKEKNRRQGYLRASDLTESQLKLLHIDSSSKHWSMTFSEDGEQVTVKSRD